MPTHRSPSTSECSRQGATHRARILAICQTCRKCSLMVLKVLSNPLATVRAALNFYPGRIRSLARSRSIAYAATSRAPKTPGRNQWRSFKTLHWLSEAATEANLQTDRLMNFAIFARSPPSSSPLHAQPRVSRMMADVAASWMSLTVKCRVHFAPTLFTLPMPVPHVTAALPTNIKALALTSYPAASSRPASALKTRFSKTSDDAKAAKSEKKTPVNCSVTTTAPSSPT